jgi:hypothetical protein
MSAAGGAFASGLGTGLIQLGTNYQQVNQQDVENRAEALKQTRLEQMQIGTQAQQGLFQSAQLGMQEQQMAAEGDRFTATHGLAQDQHTLAQKGHDLSVKTQQDTAEHQTETRKIQRETLAIERSDKEGNRAHRTAQLTQRKKEHRDTLDLAGKRFAHQQAMDEIDADIKEGNFALAEEKWDSEKNWWEREFNQKLDAYKWDKDFKTRSFAEQREQFDQNYKIKKREVSVIEARLQHEKLDSGERRKLEDRGMVVRENLAILDEQRTGIQQQEADQREAYQNGTLALKERGVDLDEAKLEFDKSKDEKDQHRKKFKYTTRPIYAMRETKAAVPAVLGTNGTVITPEVPATVESVKVGEEIIAINVSEPDITDVRILGKDGRWQYGDKGLDTEVTAILKSVQKLVDKEGISVTDALARAKESMPDRDWKTIDALLAINPPVQPTITLPAASPNAITVTPSDGGIITGGSSGEPGNISAARPTVDIAQARKWWPTLSDDEIRVRLEGPPKTSWEVGEFRQGEGWVTRKDRTRHGFTYSYSQENPNPQ